MKGAPIPSDDEARLAKLRSYEILDTEAEEAFDEITQMAARLLNVPICLVSLVDEDRQWFKSRHGLGAPQTPRDVSFCGHAVAGKEMLVVRDAFADERFADNPLVVDDPRVVFYAGVPLVTNDGHALGTLCAIDHQPREPSQEQLDVLALLARQTMNQIELRAQLRRREEMLRARELLEHRKDEFVTLVSHELRTPLTSIQGSLRLLREGVAGELPPEANKLVDVAGRNATRLIRLVSDLLDLDSLRAGSLSLDVEDVKVRELVQTSIEFNRGFASEHDVRVSAGEWDESLTIRVDRDRFAQVIDNLVSNAIKFSPSGGEVELHVERRGTRTHISVADQGPGVPEEFRESLFERFTQSKTSPNAPVAGSGLGLAIARSIAELHGAELGYEPNEPSGARFFVELPGRG